MESRGPSQTAIACALLRAAHDLLDDAPKILADPFARDFIGLASDEELRKALDAFAPRDFRRMRTLFALRSRYAEDQLSIAVERGILQYVILGAGLDSFAFRRPDLMRALHVYEVDHPASQSWKRARLAELGVAVPPTLHYVPIDLEHTILSSRLAGGGFNRDAQAFFSWLGVTQYLDRDSVLNTLREIASVTASGSELVVQYIVPPATLSQEEGELVAALADRSASMGEPWLSFFEPKDLEIHLKRIGFGEIEHFGVEQATERYLVGRKDGLTLPGYFRMIKARVGLIETLCAVESAHGRV
jgi:methyltransferase (TIGR00027 family)